MKKIFLLTSLLALSVSCQTGSPAEAPYTTPLAVGNQNIFVQVVSSSTDMEKGLSGRNSLKDTQGMLFDFTKLENKQPAFWMKDMKFSLDILWIQNNAVVGITKNIPAPKNSKDVLPSYYAPGDIDYVIEVNAGWSDAHNIKTGDSVRF